MRRTSVNVVDVVPSIVVKNIVAEGNSDAYYAYKYYFDSLDQGKSHSVYSSVMLEEWSKNGK